MDRKELIKLNIKYVRRELKDINDLISKCIRLDLSNDVYLELCRKENEKLEELHILKDLLKG